MASSTVLRAPSIFAGSFPSFSPFAASMAFDNASRVALSATLPSESASSLDASSSFAVRFVFASSSLFAALDSVTALTAFDRLCSWVLYQSACSPSFTVAASKPFASSATQPSYSGAEALSSLPNDSTVFASLTCSALTAAASAASPLSSALYSLAWLRTPSAAVAHASFASASFAPRYMFQPTTPATTSTTAQTTAIRGSSHFGRFLPSTPPRASATFAAAVSTGSRASVLSISFSGFIVVLLVLIVVSISSLIAASPARCRAAARHGRVGRPLCGRASPDRRRGSGHRRPVARHRGPADRVA